MKKYLTKVYLWIINFGMIELHENTIFSLPVQIGKTFEKRITKWNHLLPWAAMSLKKIMQWAIRMIFSNEPIFIAKKRRHIAIHILIVVYLIWTKILENILIQRNQTAVNVFFVWPSCSLRTVKYFNSVLHWAVFFIFLRRLLLLLFS